MHNISLYSNKIFNGEDNQSVQALVYPLQRLYVSANISMVEPLKQYIIRAKICFSNLRQAKLREFRSLKNTIALPHKLSGITHVENWAGNLTFQLWFKYLDSAQIRADRAQMRQNRSNSNIHTIVDFAHTQSCLCSTFIAQLFINKLKTGTDFSSRTNCSSFYS